MMDFLTFKSFISINALIVFYYIGALILPIGLWITHMWLIRKYKLFHSAYEQSKQLIWKALDKKQQIQLVLFFIILFLFMQLFWRMLFEFLIAYMQMRDVLVAVQ